MVPTPSSRQIEQATAFIGHYFPSSPKVGIVLGSGLGEVAEEVKKKIVIPYKAIPHFPLSGVMGHKGQLVLGILSGKRVAVMQGRVHFYEGYPMRKITFPIRVFQRLGVKTLIVTNAAGGLNPDFEAGDLMLITDHINLTGLAGFSALRGPNYEDLGPRFPSMVNTYDKKLQNLAVAAAKKIKMVLRQGVYINVAGPNYETPAEVRFLRMIGADAVGMSTTPEALVGIHAGMRILALSGITNVTYKKPDKKSEVTHSEVITINKVIAPKLKKLLGEVLRRA